MACSYSGYYAGLSTRSQEFDPPTSRHVYNCENIMVMIITVAQVAEVIANLDTDNLVCLTNSRNRNVAMYFSEDVFRIFNADVLVSTESDIRTAVECFNYYGSRMCC